ncbi:hypothetical protein ACFYNO_19625 [Kitasatospora sp. NPDC006697]|uniref:hypothetical protein n=1 Tax=Kitasatospora sp. NPDC006697 TaxID=3364020 RepID=UPI0036960A5D
MSDTIGSPLGGTPATGLLKQTADPAPALGRGIAHNPVPTVHEAYSFACLNCGYGWEQGYDIEHHRDRDGHLVIQYRANGVRVPSPLLKPSCPGCGGHTVRIMREGRVASTRSRFVAPGYAPYAEPAEPEQPREPREHRIRQHWYQFWLPGS